jgi:hypothetical protein
VLQLNWQFRRQKTKIDRNVRQTKSKTQWKESVDKNNNFPGKRRKYKPKAIIDDVETFAEDQKKAEHINRYIASVIRASKLNESDKNKLHLLKQAEKTHTEEQPIFKSNFNIQELMQAINKLKPRKSLDPDKRHNEMLTHLSNSGKLTIFKLINMT